MGVGLDVKGNKGECTGKCQSKRHSLLEWPKLELQLFIAKSRSTSSYSSNFGVSDTCNIFRVAPVWARNYGANVQKHRKN